MWALSLMWLVAAAVAHAAAATQPRLLFSPSPGASPRFAAPGALAGSATAAPTLAAAQLFQQPRLAALARGAGAPGSVISSRAAALSAGAAPASASGEPAAIRLPPRRAVVQPPAGALDPPRHGSVLR